MKLAADDNRFDALQCHLIGEIVTTLRDGLREAGITDDDALQDATGSLAFSIAAIIDGSRIMHLDGAEVVPVLTFARERDGEELITARSGGSWMHEYVFGTVDDVFGSEDDTPE